ncbi:MAG: hypothetical protein R3325_11200, partial [Thermoanaerobaculia bacterium]|nr:hypothetical protein [Thermoanaerobaculia bacterium]
FFRRYRERIERTGRPVTFTKSGVGGDRAVPAYRLGRTALTVAAAGFTLRHAHVLTRPIVPEHENYLDCNLGVDAFLRWRWYALNFRDMALVVG